jgi:large subunit ribosomal protein L10
MAKQEKYARLCKEKMVDEIVDSISKHPDFIITTYMGSSVSDLEGLRKNLKKSSASYLVVKNSILKVVFEKLKLEAEASKIESGMGLSLSGSDIVATCKAISTFAATHDKFKIKGAVIDGKPVSTDRVKTLASLPAKQVLLAQVVGGIKAPVTGFVYSLAGILKKFVYAVEAIRSEKEKARPAQPEAKAAEAPAAAPAQAPASPDKPASTQA